MIVNMMIASVSATRIVIQIGNWLFRNVFNGYLKVEEKKSYNMW